MFNVMNQYSDISSIINNNIILIEHAKIDNQRLSIFYLLLIMNNYNFIILIIDISKVFLYY